MIKCKQKQTQHSPPPYPSFFPCNARGRPGDNEEEEEEENRPVLKEEKEKEEEEERLAYAVEEEETEWSKVRFSDQIQMKKNPVLTCPILVTLILPAPVPSAVVPAFPRPSTACLLVLGTRRDPRPPW